jgi:uncharacterized membrane protein
MNTTVAEINNHIKLWHILLTSSIALIIAFAWRYYLLRQNKK